MPSRVAVALSRPVIKALWIRVEAEASGALNCAWYSSLKKFHGRGELTYFRGVRGWRCLREFSNPGWLLFGAAEAVPLRTSP